jgi:small-conductance mechanosensitive channel
MRGDLFLIRDYVLAHSALYSLVIIIITIILAQGILQVFEGILRHFSYRNKNFGEKLINVIETPVLLLTTLIGIEIAIRNIIVEHQSFSALILSAIIIIITYLLIKIGGLFLENWSTKMLHTKGEEFHLEILPLMRSLVSIILSFLGLVLILQAWQINIKTMLTSLGVVSVILGFAFQQTLNNVFGGISLIMDNTFRRGDLIELENGQIGEVIEINLRSTRLKNLDAESLIIPNAQLANSKIINLAQPTPTVRIRIPILVGHEADPSMVKKIIHGSLHSHLDIIRTPPPNVRFTGIGEKSLDFEIYFYINNYKKLWDIKDEILTHVHKDLCKHRIPLVGDNKNKTTQKKTMR